MRSGIRLLFLVLMLAFCNQVAGQEPAIKAPDSTTLERKMLDIRSKKKNVMDVTQECRGKH